MNILEHYIAKLRSAQDLSGDETHEIFLALQDEMLEEQTIADLLTAWNDKGAAIDEVYALATIMRSRVKKVEHSTENFIDMAGTGGSRIKTFNISTAAAFVIAGAGLPVAKHGNRAATSSSGSADVAAELGINILADPERAARCLEDIGICFMFAPLFHSLSPKLGKVRRELGFPTIFNMVGPLCNPAGAPHQIMGVWDACVLEVVPQVMQRLGTKRSWVVNGGGLDEITLAGSTSVMEVDSDGIQKITLIPGDFGIDAASIDHFTKSSPAESATLIREILSGKCADPVAVNMVLLNAAAALYVAGTAPDLISATKLAQGSIDGGAAFEKLTQLAEATNL